MPHETLKSSRFFPPACRIVEKLRQAGFTALFAGGCIRDALLGCPCEDIDIATDAVPTTIMGLFPHHAAVGASFGVVLVVEDGIPYEVATFRSDHGYADGRRPSGVTFSSPEEDSRRRDFTVNGLFYDPLERRLIDYVGGVRDLRSRLLRTIGRPEDRFGEDHLRIMRAVRFSARYGLTMETATRAAIAPLAGTLARISAERIRDELVKSLTKEGAHVALELFRSCGILDVVLPEVAALAGVQQPENFHPEGDVFTHTKLMFKNANYPLSPTLALAILLHDVGKPPTYREAEDRIRFHGHPEVGADMAGEILGRLKCSRHETEAVEAMVREHLRFANVMEMRPSTLKRFLRLPNFGEHLELHRLDCESSHRILSHYDFCKDQLATLDAEALRPAPLLGGGDLLALGLTPGPQFKKILLELEDLQLEGKVVSREEALAWVRAAHGESGEQT